MERGSSLILAVPRDARTILQMPRGNLECIQPRALSLAIIGRLIDDLDYRAAFDLMRKQRIDLNLLHDHDPQAFAANCRKFLEQVGNANWLSLFLTELRDEDVTRTTYASSYGARRRSKVEAVAGKVEAVCEMLRPGMEEHAGELVQVRAQVNGFRMASRGVCRQRVFVASWF